MFRVFMRTYQYDEHGGIESNNFAGDFETIEEAKKFVLTVSENNRAYNYDVDITFFPPKHIETITIPLENLLCLSQKKKKKKKTQSRTQRH